MKASGQNQVASMKREIRRLAALPKFNAQERTQYEEARRTLVSAGWCPVCEGEGEPARLGRWQAGTADTYAGRECLQCEEFFVTGQQAEFDTTPEAFSDADPGL